MEYIYSHSIPASLENRPRGTLDRQAFNPDLNHAEKIRDSHDKAYGQADARGENIRSGLDGALWRLPSGLREAVIVRHLAGMSDEEAGRALGCSAVAASMRDAQGLERLRDFFRKGGDAISAAALASMLDASRAVAAPPGLARRIAAVCSGTAPASPAVLEIAEDVRKGIWWMKVKTAVVIVAAAALAAGLAILSI
jgi:hypothetical protein